MWGYETIIGCGMAILSLFVLILAYWVGSSTAMTPQRGIQPAVKTVKNSHPTWPLTRKW